MSKLPFEPQPIRGIAYILIAVFFFTSLDATSKYLTRTFPLPMIVWARYSVHFLLMLILLAPSMRLKLVTTQNPWAQVKRGLVLLTTSCFGIAGFRLLPLAEATAVIFLSPLIVVLLARWQLGEKITPVRWVAVVAGFAGVLLIARPGGNLPVDGLIFMVITAVLYAIYQIQTRRLSPSENALTMLFYGAMIGTAGLSLAVPFYWGGPTPTPFQILQILSLGVLGGIGHWLFILAFRHAKASTLAPFTYAQLIWATLLGYLVYDHLPDGIALIGIVIIAVSSMSIALSERFKKPPGPNAAADTGKAH
ncbi:MAG: DMT family transporter [Rugosibacter sp.]